MIRSHPVIRMLLPVAATVITVALTAGQASAVTADASRGNETYPATQVTTQAYQFVNHRYSSICLDGGKIGKAYADSCEKSDNSQNWIYTPEDRLTDSQTLLCLDSGNASPTSGKGAVYTHKCLPNDFYQVWIYVDGTLQDYQTGLYLCYQPGPGRTLFTYHHAANEPGCHWDKKVAS
jgi:hypothetical protein